MGAAARSYELFDDDPVSPPAPLVAPQRRRRPRVVAAPVPTREPKPARGRPGVGERNPARGRPEATPARERGRTRERERDAEAVPQRRRRAESEPTPEAPPAPVTAPRAPFVMLVLILVAAGIIGLLVLNTKINENSFRLKAMRDRQVALDAREQQLGSALADKQSPGNLAAAAKRLGLVPAGTPAFLQLPDGRVLGVPQPGGARNPTTGR